MFTTAICKPLHSNAKLGQRREEGKTLCHQIQGFDVHTTLSAQTSLKFISTEADLGSHKEYRWLLKCMITEALLRGPLYLQTLQSGFQVVSSPMNRSHSPCDLIYMHPVDTCSPVAACVPLSQEGASVDKTTTQEGNIPD